MATIVQDTNFGFEQRFRKSLLSNERSYASYEKLIQYYIDLNEDGCLFNKKIIQIPIIFHIVDDGTLDRISDISIKNIVGELNAFYKQASIVFKLATVSPGGQRLKRPGIQVYDFSRKVIGYTPGGAERTYAAQGIKIKDHILKSDIAGDSEYIIYYAEDLKEELHWPVDKYFNVYLVNALRGKEILKESYSDKIARDLLKELGVEIKNIKETDVYFLENDFKYSDTVNSVTAEIDNDINSFGVIIPFYALPQDKVNYSYEASNLITMDGFSAGLPVSNFAYVIGENIPTNGNMISIIHAVALSFNLLSLYSCPFSTTQEEFISKCIPHNKYSSSFLGNDRYGDGCPDTPNIIFEEYLNFRNSNIVFACRDDEYENKKYEGDNLMAHPYFVDNKYGQNVIMPFPKFNLSTYQFYRIRANFFIHVDDRKTLLNQLSSSYTAGPGYQDPDCYTDEIIDPVEPVDPVEPTPPDSCKEPEVFTNNPDISSRSFSGVNNASIESVSARIAYSLRNVNLELLEKSVRDFNKLIRIIKSIK